MTRENRRGFWRFSTAPETPSRHDEDRVAAGSRYAVSGRDLGRLVCKPLDLAQLPPTLRGVRERGTKPRVEAAFQGWSVLCFGARLGTAPAGSDDEAGCSAAASDRVAAASASSFARQQCLYLRPDPQRQGSL